MNEVPWYALYSKPRHEKKLADLLNEKGNRGVCASEKGVEAMERPEEDGGGAFDPFVLFCAG